MSTDERPLAFVSAAHQEIMPLLRSLDESKVRTVRATPRRAADTALASALRIEPFRDKLAALPKIGVSDLDLLPKLAHTLLWIEVRITNASSCDRRALADAGFAHRSKLVVAARPLAEAGLLDSDRVEAIGRRRGYRDLADDLLALASLYGEAWPKVIGKTTVTVEDVRRSGELHARLLLSLLGPTTNELTLRQLRARALTLLNECYGRLRKAIHYLRDSASEARRLMPSLRRPPRKRTKVEAAPRAPVETVAPAGASTSSANPPEPSAPVVSPAPAPPRADEARDGPRPGENGRSGPIADEATATGPPNGATGPPATAPS